MKYKLIKKYPTSPPINSISENKYCSNYPEFWQEVIEKDYEILSYIFKLENCIIEPKNLLFNNGDWDIYAVKRLSDGEIFTVGDKFNTIFTITEIKLVDKEIQLCTGCKAYYPLLSCKKKVKQPLFTTEDGVNIYEGDIVYSVSKSFYLNKNVVGITVFSNCRIFSTKEKAEEYILYNKLCLSYGDIQEFLKIKDCNKVLELVQQKLKSC